MTRLSQRGWFLACSFFLSLVACLSFVIRISSHNMLHRAQMSYDQKKKKNFSTGSHTAGPLWPYPDRSRRALGLSARAFCSLSVLSFCLLVFCSPPGPSFGASGLSRGLPFGSSGLLAVALRGTPPQAPPRLLWFFSPSLLAGNSVFPAFFSSSQPVNFFFSCLSTGMCLVTSWVLVGSASSATVFAFFFESVLAHWFLYWSLSRRSAGVCQSHPPSDTGSFLGGSWVLWRRARKMRRFWARATHGNPL